MNRQRRRPQTEKVEIALERGQVTTVLVGSVVALGLVFLMGVVFGSRLAVAAEAGEHEVGGAAVATTSTVEKPELTFHDALTTRRTGGMEQSAAAAVTASPQVQAAAERSAQSPEPAVQREPPQARPQPAAAPAARASVAPAPASAATDSAPSFTVQVSSSRDESDTKRLSDRLVAAGWDARVVAADIEGRGRWYRVRVGRYDTRDEAMRRQAELQQAFRLSGLVVAEQ